eukprot:PhM_4_TR13796/c0_g2_i1/m.63723
MFGSVTLSTTLWRCTHRPLRALRAPHMSTVRLGRKCRVLLPRRPHPSHRRCGRARSRFARRSRTLRRGQATLREKNPPSTRMTMTSRWRLIPSQDKSSKFFRRPQRQQKQQHQRRRSRQKKKKTNHKRSSNFKPQVHHAMFGMTEGALEQWGDMGAGALDDDFEDYDFDDEELDAFIERAEDAALVEASNNSNENKNVPTTTSSNPDSIVPQNCFDDTLTYLHSVLSLWRTRATVSYVKSGDVEVVMSLPEPQQHRQEGHSEFMSKHIWTALKQAFKSVGYSNSSNEAVDLFEIDNTLRTLDVSTFDYGYKEFMTGPMWLVLGAVILLAAERRGKLMRKDPNLTTREHILFKCVCENGDASRGSISPDGLKLLVQDLFSFEEIV